MKDKFKAYLGPVYVHGPWVLDIVLKVVKIADVAIKIIDRVANYSEKFRSKIYAS